MYTAPKSTNESIAHFSLEPARGSQHGNGSGALNGTLWSHCVHHAVAAAIRKLPPDWKRQRRNHTWLRANTSDLRPLNISSSYAWKKASSQEHWDSTVDMTMLKKSIPCTERMPSMR